MYLIPTKSLPSWSWCRRPLIRKLVQRCGVAVATGAMVLCAVPLHAGQVERTQIDVKVSQGTNMAIAVSPDRTQMVFDLQGALWLLPMQGGRARRITAIDMESRYPQWAPDGSHIVFQCYRDNQWHICTIDRDGAQLQQLTSGASDDREPGWSADGKRVVYVSDARHNYDLWEIEVASKEVHQLARTEAEEAFPAWAPHGNDQLAYIVERPEGASLMLRARDGHERELVNADKSQSLLLPSWRPDGQAIAFVKYDRTARESSLNVVSLEDGSVTRISGPREDVFASQANWLDDKTLVYGADGGIRKRAMGRGRATSIGFEATLPVEHDVYVRRKLAAVQEGERPVLGILRPHVSPDGTQIVFAALGDLWLLQSGQSHPRRLTDDTALDADPVFSPDGKEIAFTSDQRESGTMDLCLLDLRSGVRRILTSPGESVSLPNFSPDGSQIAYLVSDSANWHARTVHILELKSGAIRKAPEHLFHPSRPSWSPDNRHLALSALEQSSGRFRKGWSEILLLDTSNFSSRFLEPIPGRSLGVRAANGPEWSPDGTHLAFVSDGTLWSWGVSSAGDPAGSALRLTNELADSISWTADSGTLVYLSNGHLRRLNVQDGQTTDIPLDLTWQPPQPKTRIVVRAGRLFDGTTSQYRRNVDIVIDGRRITAVQPARQDWGKDVRVIDATGKTVIPGLFESHIHNFTINGEATGRMFLSFGVTSIREVGADPYDALESKEAWGSGARPGPRSFYSGLLEGGRVFYPMSLAIDSVGHLTQELGRAKALDYDLVKTYERLPDAQLARVIRFAHENGLTTTSHDLWPAAAFGGDVVEHLESTDRGEFTDRQSFRGEVYDDVIQLLKRSGMAITSTTFGFYPGIERPPGAKHWSVTDLAQVRGVLPSRIHELLGKTDAGSVSAEEEASWKQAEASTVKYVGKLRKAGIPLIPATDGSFHLAGLALIREIIAIHDAGTPMPEVLRAATQGAARILGADTDLGTIEPGKLADLVVIEGDPLKVPTDLTNVAAVMKDGLVFTQADLARRDRPAQH